MPFQKGNNANPRGRPRGGLALAEKIREKAGNDAGVYVDELHRIAMSRRIAPKVRVEVIRLLLDKGYGKAPTDINVNTGNNVDLTGVDLDRLTDDQVQRLLDLSTESAQILKAVREDQKIH